MSTQTLSLALNVDNQLDGISGYLRNFAMFLTKDVEDANDLYQDTMLRILSNREKFSLGTNFRAWCSTIMRNIFINAYRKKKLSQTIIDKSADGYLITNASGSSVENGGEGIITLQEIMKAIGELREELSQPFMMAYHGYKYDEIATMLELPLGTVKSRIFFARQELQQKLSSLAKTND